MRLKRKKTFYIAITAEGTWEISTCLTSGIWAASEKVAGLTTFFFNKAQGLVSQNQGQKSRKNTDVSLSNKPHRKGSQHIISQREEITQRERADVENNLITSPRACHPLPHHFCLERCCRDRRSMLGSSKSGCWTGTVPAAPAPPLSHCPVPLASTATSTWEQLQRRENVLFPVTPAAQLWFQILPLLLIN